MGSEEGLSRLPVAGVWVCRISTSPKAQPLAIVHFYFKRTFAISLVNFRAGLRGAIDKVLLKLLQDLIPNPFGITPFTQAKTFAPRGFGQSVGCLS
ncbi:hypothetical protein [Microcoleus sp. FACHB-68]|uniref:hypothetical protein n=1 Tax=Microcoleus sp. FACHB-68 TaxID=2692826 RepID=UPI0016844ABC|nr:hypothetical protein [Microcoleus sp. FACHB-68]MBD1937729.1 hypothetical protein [Microcoleus sp. FACHB-68]